MLNLVEILFFNYIVVQAFPVFTFDGSLDHSGAPSFASLVADVHLPESFIVCSSSKVATFSYVSFYSIFGEDSKVWLAVAIRPHREAIVLAVYWDGGMHFSEHLKNPKLDHWYHICLKIDVKRKEIEFAVDGMLMRRVVDQNITNVPNKLRMNIGVDHENRQFRGSDANIQVFNNGNITKISAAPCTDGPGTLLSWNPQHWKVTGLRWIMKEEYKEIICTPNERYNLAVPSEITFQESVNLCKQQLSNSVIPYPENNSALLKYVTWHNNTTGGTCPCMWTPLSDENSEGVFFNVNINSTVQYQNWGKREPNGGKKENHVIIKARTTALNDVDKNRLFCSACSISSSLVLRLDGVCQDSFIGTDLKFVKKFTRPNFRVKEFYTLKTHIESIFASNEQ